MRNTQSEIKADCNFRRVATYVNSCDCDLSREKIDLAFPDMKPKQITKALENACHRKLIHSVARNVYRGGPKPVDFNVIRVIDANMESANPDTTEVVSTALEQRTAIERVWHAMVNAVQPQAQHAFA